jgi:hypothetical protein
MYKHRKKYGVLLSQALFLASLTQDMFTSGFPTLWVLLFGWAGLYYSLSAVAWFANPCIIIAWRTVNKRPRMSLLFSVLAVIAAVAFLFFRDVYKSDSDINSIADFNAYYWLWLGSCFVMLATNLTGLLKKHKRSITAKIIQNGKLIEPAVYV